MLNSKLKNRTLHTTKNKQKNLKCLKQKIIVNIIIKKVNKNIILDTLSMKMKVKFCKNGL